MITTIGGFHLSRRGQVIKLAAIAVVVMLVSLTSVQCAFAEHSENAAAGPDIRVILKATGDAVGGAKVFIGDELAGTTDSKGNLTLKEAPAAGNHTVTVMKNNLQNETINTNFAVKPTIISMVPSKGGKTIIMHVTDKNSKDGIANVTIINNKYVMGTTNATGYLTMENFPQGLYIFTINATGYKDAKSVVIGVYNQTRNIVMTPV